MVFGCVRECKCEQLCVYMCETLVCTHVVVCKCSGVCACGCGRVRACVHKFVRVSMFVDKTEV